MKKLGMAIFQLSLGMLIAFGIGEGAIRLSSIQETNYTIEMWRYAKGLKVASDNPQEGHTHVKNASMSLQGVEIRLNNLGLRGPDLDLAQLASKKVVFLLGDSVTLGWGVPEDQTLAARLQKALGADYVVVNGGIGNLNIQQLAARWERLSQVLSPDLLVVLPSIRAAEAHNQQEASWLVKNSQLAAVTSVFIQQFLMTGAGQTDYVGNYRQKWQEFEEQGVFSQAFKKIHAQQQKGGYPVLYAMIPDMHDLTDYPFEFTRKIVEENARRYNADFVSLFPSFKGLIGRDFWVSGHDPHPNGKAFEIIAGDLIGPIRSRTQAP